MQGINAPNLEARVFIQPPGNLGARIHAPLDLPAALLSVQKLDLPADIFAFQFSDMPATMFGQPAPVLTAFLRGFVSDFSDLPSIVSSRDESDIGANLIASIPGPEDMLGNIISDGFF